MFAFFFHIISPYNKREENSNHNIKHKSSILLWLSVEMLTPSVFLSPKMLLPPKGLVQSAFQQAQNAENIVTHLFSEGMDISG